MFVRCVGVVVGWVWLVAGGAGGGGGGGGPAGIPVVGCAACVC